MILLLDTNILSALMRPAPDQPVLDWLARQRAEQLFSSALSQAEILAGLATMPEGQRRTALLAAARAMFEEDFADRLLPFDHLAAEAYARLFAARRRAGRPCTTLDLMIAAIAASRDAAVVTRNSSDFAGFGVPVIDPWAG